MERFGNTYGLLKDAKGLRLQKQGNLSEAWQGHSAQGPNSQSRTLLSLPAQCQEVGDMRTGH